MAFPIMGQPDTGDTAWMLASSALVLLMTPGLAFFYGGMVRTRSVLNMIMMSVSAMGVVTVLWVLYGYSMSFGDDKWGVVGNPADYWGLKGLIGGNAVKAAGSTPNESLMSTRSATPRAAGLPLSMAMPRSAPCPPPCSLPSSLCSRSSPSR